jgi:hypothetical protein
MARQDGREDLSKSDLGDRSGRLAYGPLCKIKAVVGSRAPGGINKVLAHLAGR